MTGDVEGTESLSWFRLPGATAAEDEPAVSGWRLLSDEDAEPYVNCVPLYSLQAAAGAFSEGQAPEREGWVAVETKRKLREGMFAAQVVGHSMEPRIPDGAYCLFQHPVTGSRDGRIVLVQHHAISDPETGGQYTVKRYASSKETGPDGSWTHTKITLQPLNPGYEPMELEPADEGEVAVLAEVIEVLGGAGAK